MKRAKRQYGALPFRRTADGDVEILLITSRDTGRWVIPKGWPMKGKKAFSAAAQEAWEEAGVLGKIAKKPLGRFEYDKVLTDGEARCCSVIVFPMAVETVDSTWPESGQRERSWMRPEDASEVVNEKGLARILIAFGAAARSAGLDKRKDKATAMGRLEPQRRDGDKDNGQRGL